MRVHLFLVAAIGLASASCIAMPGDSARSDRPPIAFPVVGGSSSGDNVDAYPMLEDPEAEVTEETDDVWAKNQAEADRKCEEIAESRSQTGAVVTVQGKAQQATSRASRYGEFRFVCRFRIES